MQIALDLSVADNAVYFGRSGKLALSLINKTGEPLPLDGGVINLVFPTEIFAPAEVANMGLALRAGWTKAAVGQIIHLTPPPGAIIEPGDPLDLELTNVASSGTRATTGQLWAKYVGLDVAPRAIAKALTLGPYPSGELRNLHDHVALELEDRVVYRSYDLDNPIVNDLVLNIRNTTKEVLVTREWGAAAPTIEVTLVTGDVVGALTRPSKGPDSPLNIELDVHQIYESLWNVPTSPAQLDKLSWVVTPVKEVNKHVLGVEQGAGLGLRLGNIVTVLPAGHTQLYIHFSNFPGYADRLFALDVEKRDPVAGVLDFSVEAADIVRGEQTGLRWSTFAVSRLVLEYTEDGARKTLSSANPGDGMPLNPLKATRTFAVSPKVTTTYTLHAYDMQGFETPLGGQVTVTVAQPELSIRSFTAAPNPVDVSSGPAKVMLSWSVENYESAGKIELDPFGVLTSAQRQVAAMEATVVGTTNMVLRVYSADGPLADARSLAVQSISEWLVGKVFGASGRNRCLYAQFTSPYWMSLTIKLQGDGRYGETWSGAWSLRDGVIQMREKEHEFPHCFTIARDVLTLTRSKWSSPENPDSWRHDWLAQIGLTLPMKAGVVPECMVDPIWADGHWGADWEFGEYMRNHPMNWWRPFVVDDR